MKNEKGITLTSLVIMIIILIILASIATYSGVGTIRYTNYNKAKAEMQIMQANVNKWHEENLNGNDDVLNYGDDINNISVALSEKVTETFSKVGITDQNVKERYKFFSKDYLKNNLGLDASFEYIVNIIDRDVILVGGVLYDSKTYYTLEDFELVNVKENLPNTISFNLEQEVNSNIIISDLKLLDSDSKEANISKFRVFSAEKDSSNWMEITDKVKEIVYNNKKAYLISGLEYNDYDIKISTTDNIIFNKENINILNHRATFKPGPDVNAKMKQLANNNNTATFETADRTITAIKRADTIDNQYKTANNIVSTDDSKVPIYMWFDNGTIWYYTIDENPNLNIDSSYLFSTCLSISELDVTDFYTSNVENMSNMFAGATTNSEDLGTDKDYTMSLTNIKGLTSLDTSKVTNMEYMFWNCTKIVSLDVSKFDTSKVTTMRSMFNNCSKLTELNVSEFDTREVTKMQSMFYNCKELTSINVSGFDTSNVTNMSNMFNRCSGLTSLNVSNFNTSNVTSMASMFNRCNDLKHLDVSNFNTSNVTSMTYMFTECNALISLDVSHFDTAKVTSMSNMFFRCRELTALDLSDFDTSEVTNMYQMFFGCRNLTTIYASNKFVTNKYEKSTDSSNNIIDSTEMFNNCYSLVGGSGTTFNSLKVDKTYAHIDGGPSNPGYFSPKASI